MTRSRRRRTRNVAIAAVFAGAAAVALLVGLGCGSIRRASRAAAVLAEVGSAAPPADAAAVVAAEVSFASGAGETRGTIYRLARPDAAASPGVVLSHGAAEAGYRDARLVRLAGALARAGLVVLTPDLAELRALKVDALSIARIEAAHAYLRGRSDLVGEERVSLAGISFAGSFSLLAAASESIRDEVAAVLAFGAYHDLERLLSYWLSAPPPDVEGVYPIASYGRWIALLNHLGDLVPPEDEAPLRATLESLLRGKGAGAEPAPLSPRGAAVYAAARDTGPLSRELTEDVIAAARERLAPLAIEGRLAGIRAPVFLLHARGDELVPEENSVAIAAEIEESGTVRVKLLVSDAFRHVTVGTDDGLGLLDVLPEVFFLASFFAAAGL